MLIFVKLIPYIATHLVVVVLLILVVGRPSSKT